MKRWLEDNPLGVALASFSAFLLLILLLLAVAWSLPPRGADDPSGGDGQELRVEVPELAPPAAIEEFAVITERPVFNESRRPEYLDEAGGEGEGEGEEAAETLVDAPDVQLAGVVITPSLRMATLKPKGSAESLIALEGSPLEGDYGSWQVSTVEPRSVVLSAADGREVRLELQLHDKAIAEPPKPPPSAPAREAGDEDAEGGEKPLSRAEEIRQRIAERREELRRAAEENAEQAAPRPPSYSAAIQQMIQGKRTEGEDENQEQ